MSYLKKTEQIKSLERDVKQLTAQTTERIEYVIPVKYHISGCPDKEFCDCPTRNEGRSRIILHKPLVVQLRNYAQNADLGAEPKSERAAPNKPGSRPPANMAGFHLLDEIACEAYVLADRFSREAGRGAEFGLANLEDLLNSLPYQCMQVNDDYPHIVSDTCRAARSWVGRAHLVLGYKTTEVAFRDTACTECGGVLVVGRDPKKTKVRCTGRLDAPPCGREYPMTEWLKLYEESRRASK